jgi:Cu(I)/Ag(I) efflux system membrane protein CusA/SilA
MKKTLALVLALAAAGAVSAQGMNMPMESKKAPVPSSKSAMPLVDAVVQKLDTAKQLIVLKHGDIPNLGMSAMTMGFDVADKKMLKAVKAGDKVKFQAEMLGGRATVTELKRLR